MATDTEHAHDSHTEGEAHEAMRFVPGAGGDLRFPRVDTKFGLLRAGGWFDSLHRCGQFGSGRKDFRFWADEACFSGQKCGMREGSL